MSELTLTKPIERALRSLQGRSAHRISEGWLGHDHHFIAHMTMKWLLKHGCAKRDLSCRNLRITQKGRAALLEHHAKDAARPAWPSSVDQPINRS